MKILRYFVLSALLIASQLSYAFVIGHEFYRTYKGPDYAFVYPEKWNVLLQAEIYGSNCVTLKDKKNMDNDFELLICSERGRPSPKALREHGFKRIEKGKWEIIGAMDSVAGIESIFRNERIVEGISSCRFSDENGVHSAGDCYKSLVVLSNSYFFIESRGHRSVNDEFQVYRLISRSLISTRANALLNFYKKSTPLRKMQPL